MNDNEILQRIQVIMSSGESTKLTSFLNELLQRDTTQAMRILHKLGMRPTIQLPGQDDEKSAVN